MTDEKKEIESEKKFKRMISVIKWPNGFVNFAKIDDSEGAMLEQELDFIVDKMCKDHKTEREEVGIRVFNISSVDLKERLSENKIKDETCDSDTI